MRRFPTESSESLFTRQRIGNPVRSASNSPITESAGRGRVEGTTCILRISSSRRLDGAMRDLPTGRVDDAIQGEPDSERARHLDPRVRVLLSMFDSAVKTSGSLSVAEAAHQLNLSPSRVRVLFTREVGVPPGRYLHNLRMREARNLLESTFLSVKEVVGRVGFRDQSRFARDFRQRFGCSPRQYRAMHWRSQRTLRPDRR